MYVGIAAGYIGRSILLPAYKLHFISFYYFSRFFLHPVFCFSLFIFLARLLLKRQLLPDNRNKQYSHCSRFQCLYMSVLLCAYVVFSIYERSLPRAVFFFFFLLLPSTNEWMNGGGGGGKPWLLRFQSVFFSCSYVCMCVCIWQTWNNFTCLRPKGIRKTK